MIVKNERKLASSSVYTTASKIPCMIFTGHWSSWRKMPLVIHSFLPFYMKRTTTPPRRSSRNRKANQFFGGDTWIQDEKPTLQSPRPTTPPDKPPSIPRKQKPILILQQRITRIPILRDTAPVMPERVQNTSFTSFSFSNRSGNSREIIEIADEEDAVLTMNASVLREKLQCMLCVSKMRNRVFIPCGHFVTCAGCADVVAAKGTCVCCRAPITSVIQTKYD